MLLLLLRLRLPRCQFFCRPLSLSFRLSRSSLYLRDSEPVEPVERVEWVDEAELVRVIIGTVAREALVGVVPFARVPEVMGDSPFTTGGPEADVEVAVVGVTLLIMETRGGVLGVVTGPLGGVVGVGFEPRGVGVLGRETEPAPVMSCFHSGGSWGHLVSQLVVQGLKLKSVIPRRSLPS